MKVNGTINFGIFPGKCHFDVGWTFEDAQKELTDEWIAGVETFPEFFTGYRARWVTLDNKETKEEVKLFYIHLDSFKYQDIDYIRLSHEILHIVNFHLKDILNRDEEFEAEAYLHTHLMQQCLDIINKCHDTKELVSCVSTKLTDKDKPNQVPIDYFSILQEVIYEEYSEDEITVSYADSDNPPHTEVCIYYKGNRTIKATSKKVVDKSHLAERIVHHLIVDGLNENIGRDSIEAIVLKKRNV